MEENSEGYKHYSTDGGGVTGVAGYIFFLHLTLTQGLPLLLK